MNSSQSYCMSACSTCQMAYWCNYDLLANLMLKFRLSVLWLTWGSWPHQSLLLSTRALYLIISFFGKNANSKWQVLVCPAVTAPIMLQWLLVYGWINFGFSLMVSFDSSNFHLYLFSMSWQEKEVPKQILFQCQWIEMNFINAGDATHSAINAGDATRTGINHVLRANGSLG